MSQKKKTKRQQRRIDIKKEILVKKEILLEQPEAPKDKPKVPTWPKPVVRVQESSLPIVPHISMMSRNQAEKCRRAALFSS